MGPVQQAFTECHGLQCGFCTPGFLTTITAYLEEHPHPDDRGGPRGDLGQPVPLHRLPEHRQVACLRAAEIRAERASERPTAADERGAGMTTQMFGAPIKRKEDPRLVTGGGRYLDDLGHDALAAAFVRSPHAHARIVDIDVERRLRRRRASSASATHEDLPGQVGEPLPLLIPHPTLTHGRTGYALAKDEVNHVGEADRHGRRHATATSPRTPASGSSVDLRAAARRRRHRERPRRRPRSSTTTCPATSPPTCSRRSATSTPPWPPRRTP